MRRDIFRRLDALDRQLEQNQEAAEREAFLTAAWYVMFAYHVGDLKLNESPEEGFARALNYRNHDAFLRAYARALKTGDASELQNRHNDAIRRLLVGFDYDECSSQTALEEAITKRAKWLPERCRAWITSQVDEEVDYGKDLQQEERVEQVLEQLESMAAHEGKSTK
jgi:hypothetical protein